MGVHRLINGERGMHNESIRIDKVRGECRINAHTVSNVDREGNAQ